MGRGRLSPKLPETPGLVKKPLLPACPNSHVWSRRWASRSLVQRVPQVSEQVFRVSASEYSGPAGKEELAWQPVFQSPKVVQAPVAHWQVRAELVPAVTRESAVLEELGVPQLEPEASYSRHAAAPAVLHLRSNRAVSTKALCGEILHESR